MKFDPKDWTYEYTQRGGQPLIMADLWCQALYFRYPKEIGLDVPGLDYLKTSENKGYYLVGEREMILEKFKEKLNDPAYLKYIFDGAKKRTDEFVGYMETTRSERKWNEFVERVLNLIPWFWIPWYITEFNLLSDKVVSGLKDHQQKIEAIIDLNNAAMLLMFPQKELELQKEQAALNELVELTRKGINVFSDKAASAQVDDYLRNFGWIKTFILVPAEALDRKALMEKINNAIKEKSDVVYNEQRERKLKDKETVAALMGVLKNDHELLKMIESAQYLAWLLTWSVERSLYAFALGIPWYKEICKTIGLDYQDWVYLTVGEISESLKTKKCVIANDEIAKRKNGFVYILLKGSPSLLVGDEAAGMIKMLKELEETGIDKKSVKELIGKSASPGKTSGIVRICKTANEAGAVKEGDILVCGMTSPDYVPAMKRAGAIVTDEGGLLCHAAIISRELGKPCVIATKNATRLLATGDLVEVDADEGVVKILKRG